MSLSVFSLMLMVFGLTTGEFVIAGILPDVATGLAVSVPAAGLLVTAYALGMIVGGPVVTMLTARYARKPLIAWLIAVSMLGNLGSAVAPGYSVLLIARFLAGLVVATFFAVAITTTVSLAPQGKQASAVAKVTLGLNLGIILGAPLGTVIGRNLGWRSTFLFVVAVSIVALILVLRNVAVQPASTTGSVRGELRVFAGRDFLLAITLTALGNVGVVTVFSYISPLLTTVSGFSAGAVPVLLLVYGAGAVIGNFLGGWLSDKALMPSLTALLAMTAGILLLYWVLGANQVGAVLLTFAVGVLAFAIIPGMQTRVLTAATAAPALAVAVNASGFQLAAAFAGWLGGQTIAAGGLRSIYLVGAAFTLAGLFIAIYLLRRDRRVLSSAT